MSRGLADGGKQLAAQIPLALRREKTLLAHVKVSQGLLQGERAEIACRVLKGRILHDSFEKRLVADAKMKVLGMGIDGRPADQPFKHPVLKTRFARFLQGKAAACIGAHGAQDLMLSARIVLGRDLGIADPDQGLAADSLGKCPRSPRWQSLRPACPSGSCRTGVLLPFAKCRVPRRRTFLLAVCNRRAEASIFGDCSRGADIIGSKTEGGKAPFQGCACHCRPA